MTGGRDHIRLSAGTAAVCGLISLRQDIAPTTAYLLLGDGCSGHCAFCPQAQAGPTGQHFLSRIIWPEFAFPLAMRSLERAIGHGRFQRVCLQLTQSDTANTTAERTLAELAPTGIPISLSQSPERYQQLESWSSWGVERIGLPLDAATAAIYHQVKQGSWAEAQRGLLRAISLFPGRVSTHLIIGLGESEEEAVTFIRHMLALGIKTGLFAFTPVKGSAMSATSPPQLATYRRLQVARWLLEQQPTGFAFTFAQGGIKDYGIVEDQIARLPGIASAFETSGCEHCNRPYYNEKPGGIWYNYPRQLHADEVTACIQQMRA